MNQKKTLSEPKKKFEVKDNKKYKVKTIIDNTVYGKTTNNL